MPRTWLFPTTSVKSPPKRKQNSNHNTLKPSCGLEDNTLAVSLWDETTLASFPSCQGSKINTEAPPSRHPMAHLYYLLRPSLKNQVSNVSSMYTVRRENLSPKNPRQKCCPTTWVDQKSHWVGPWRCFFAYFKNLEKHEVISQVSLIGP